MDPDAPKINADPTSVPTNQCYGSESAWIRIPFGRLDPHPDPHWQKILVHADPLHSNKYIIYFSFWWPGIDGGHVHETFDTHLAADARNGGRPPDVDVLKWEVGRLNAASDEVDHNGGVLDGPANRVLVLQFERAEEHLPQVTHNLANRAKKKLKKSSVADPDPVDL